MLCVGSCSIEIRCPLDTKNIEQKYLSLSTYLLSSNITYWMHHFKHLCFSHIDIHLPTLHLVFRPQSPMLTNHERRTPTPQSNSRSGKVKLLHSILKEKVQYFWSGIVLGTHAWSVCYLLQMAITGVTLSCVHTKSEFNSWCDEITYKANGMMRNRVGCRVGTRSAVRLQQIYMKGRWFSHPSNLRTGSMRFNHPLIIAPSNDMIFFFTFGVYTALGERG